MCSKAFFVQNVSLSIATSGGVLMNNGFDIDDHDELLHPTERKKAMS